ncbi:hypothetical protein M6B38_120050 [Iris pallida]|uniref:Uncharacterized protein n=1 Tax=Iris pallida TaxID=29817 RepID=A0AAX6EEX7_IRIPA|nr:hypothetical protein M6B38_191915 [Iris pallida]KAJ6837499.1 hypothetical protein M6B38_120050 [Iris pallida]
MSLVIGRVAMYIEKDNYLSCKPICLIWTWTFDLSIPRKVLIS